MTPHSWMRELKELSWNCNECIDTNLVSCCPLPSSMSYQWHTHCHFLKIKTTIFFLSERWLRVYNNSNDNNDRRKNFISTPLQVVHFAGPHFSIWPLIIVKTNIDWAGLVRLEFVKWFSGLCFLSRQSVRIRFKDRNSITDMLRQNSKLELLTDFMHSTPPS